MHAIQILLARPEVERLGWVLLHFVWQGAMIAGFPRSPWRFGRLWRICGTLIARRVLPEWRRVCHCRGLLLQAKRRVAWDSP
jgi:hypothetical protein